MPDVDAIRRRLDYAVPRDGVRIGVHSLQLWQPLRTDDTLGNLWVEADVLGLGDPRALTTARHRRTASPLDFRFRYELPVVAGSHEQATLREALQAADEQASDVYLALKTTGRESGDAVQIAQGYVNLKRLLDGGRDLIAEPVALKRSDGSHAGTVTLTLYAIRALRDAMAAAATAEMSAASELVAPDAEAPSANDEVPDSSKPIAAALATVPLSLHAPLDVPTVAVAPPSVVIEMGELQLAPEILELAPEMLSFVSEVQQVAPEIGVDATGGDVWMEVDLINLGDPRALTTARHRRTASPLDFRFRYELPVVAGSHEQATLREALQAADEQASDVYLALKTTGRESGDAVQIAQGYVNLKRLLEGGRDLVSAPVAMQGRFCHAGTLWVSLSALDALRQAVPR